MGTATKPSNSATARPIRLRARGDLVVLEQQFGGRTYWAVKDPVSLRYFHLREEEYAVLGMLDGEASIESIRDEFERRFAPRRLSINDLQAFLMQLHGEGLVVADAHGQGGELHERAAKAARTRTWAKWANPLAIQLPGFDPQWLIDELYDLFGWIFSRWFAVLCGLLVFGAVVLVAMNADDVARRLPRFQELFTLGNLPLLAIALAFAKLLHELGHAMTLRHYGGRCPEMGVLLLVFTPTLYCNVSDAWMLPSKWQRIAVGTAGVIVEIVLASICTFLWYFSVDGVFNALCLNLVFVCSVSTLLFNANPLLRYDGYYVLFDWLEVPNARQRATALVSGSLGRFFLGLDPPNQRWLPDRLRGFLVGYAIAAVLYRVFITLTILWFVEQMLKPYRLEAVARVLAVLVVSGLVAGPVIKSGRFLADPTRRTLVKWKRLLVRGGLVAGGLAIVLLVPFPARVTSAVLVLPREAETIYVTTPGRLVSAVDAGDPVEPDAVLATLVNETVDFEIAKLQAELELREKRLETLESRRNSDPEAEPAIPTAKKAVADAKQRLAKRVEDRDRLVLTSPVAGTVIPAPELEADEQRNWDGHPLEERNRRAFLEKGTVLCLVGDPSALEAVLVVDQSNVEFVEVDQRVYLRFEEMPSAGVEGTVVELAAIDLDVIPPQLRQHVDVPVVMEDGRPRPLSTSYLARVKFAEDAPRVPIGATGRAAIEVAPRSIAQRFVRFVRRTFKFDW